MATLQSGHGLDRDGYIVSDVGLDKIDNAYLPCMQASIHKLIDLFPRQLHSVYVYGSVARGEAVPVQSDLDLLAAFTGELSSEESAKLRAAVETLSQNYHSLVRDIGIAVTNYGYIMDPQNFYEQAFLKEMCVCVHGEDLRVRFGPYKLTSDIAVSFNGDIGEVFSNTMKRLRAATSNEEFQTICQKFARRLIRTCYSMVMARSQIWSTRLHEQAQVFICYFPDKEPMIRTLQKWVEASPENREGVLELFHSEGTWITANFEQEARIAF